MSPELGHRLDVLALVLVALIVVTGGAVRLTGSGLGCSDWPECSVGHLTPALQFHGLVEFGNRLVTVVLTVAVAAAFLAAVFRSPRRRDLVWLSGGLVAGVLAQAVLGGIVVYTKLNPYLVMVHFVATILLVADAVVLVHRDRLDYSPGSGRLLVPRPVIRAFYALLALLALVITAGTATTGAGPHAGDSSGQQVARRIPVALRDMAELHSSLALLMVGLTVGLVVALLSSIGVPSRVQRSARILLMSWWRRRRSATRSTSRTSPRCWSSCISPGRPRWRSVPSRPSSSARTIRGAGGIDGAEGAGRSRRRGGCRCVLGSDPVAMERNGPQRPIRLGFPLFTSGRAPIV